MKILYIVHSVSWKGGGAFFHAYHLAKKLHDLGHETAILTISPNEKKNFKEKVVSGVRMIESPDMLKGSARSGWDPYNTYKRINFLKQEKFDLVHCLDCRPAVILPGLYAKYKRGAKLIIEWLDWFGKGGTATERSWKVRLLMGSVEGYFEEAFRHHADGTIGLGEPLTQRARDLGIKDNITTILHGSDTDDFKLYSKKEARNKAGLKEDAIYIGYTGRMRDDVAERFVQTIDEVRKTEGENVYGLLVGNSAFDLTPYLKGREDYIIRTGWIDYDQVNYYMSSCDMFLLAFSKSVARRTIWPSKVNDFFAAGRPTVATNLDVLKDIFSKNEPGILCDDTPAALAKGCIKVLHNKDMAETMGMNARKLAENELSWNKIAKDVEVFYQKVCNTA